MASISKDPNGRRVIQFIAQDGIRRSIRLGKISQRHAEAVKQRIEQLVASQITGHAIDDETARWVAGLDRLMSDKLSRVGLIAQRDEMTLKGYLEDWIVERSDVKEATRITYRNVQRNLVDFFGDKKQLRDVMPGDADQFRLWLNTHEKLSDNTIRRRTGIARQFFKTAMRRCLIQENPFNGLPASVRRNPDKFRFVTRDEAKQILDSCPDAQWKLIFALSRFGGLRCPSEHLALTWSDVDWERSRITVRSSKTEHHPGGGSRIIPIFPELLPHLRSAFEEADGGTRYVITRYRVAGQNLRTELGRIIRRAGMKVWPKLFQNLRSSRETELARDLPLHVVCEWIGNSQPVAIKHYLQVTDADFEAAIRGITIQNAEEEALHNPVQQVHASGCNALNTETAMTTNPRNGNDLHVDAETNTSLQHERLGPAGLEHISKTP